MPSTSSAAGGVIVSDNVIRECAFSAIRNNAGDRVQMIGKQLRRFRRGGAVHGIRIRRLCHLPTTFVERAANGIVSTNLNDYRTAGRHRGQYRARQLSPPGPAHRRDSLRQRYLCRKQTPRSQAMSSRMSRLRGSGWATGRICAMSARPTTCCAIAATVFAVSVVDAWGALQITGQSDLRSARGGDHRSCAGRSRRRGELLNGSNTVPAHVLLSGNHAH